jgi:hypothetical protein
VQIVHHVLQNPSSKNFQTNCKFTKQLLINFIKLFSVASPA